MKRLAAVSCSADGYRLGGVKMGLGTTGKLGRAWHRCMAFFGWASWAVHSAWHRCMAVHDVSYFKISS